MFITEKIPIRIYIAINVNFNYMLFELLYFRSVEMLSAVVSSQ